MRSLQQSSVSDDAQIPTESQHSESAVTDFSPRNSVNSRPDDVDSRPDNKLRTASVFENHKPSAGDTWNANYFPQDATPKDRRLSSTAKTAAGARSPEELLRRFSIAPKDRVVEDPRKIHPSLDLTGKLISATFCVPYKIGYCPNGEWVGLHTQITRPGD